MLGISANNPIVCNVLETVVALTNIHTDIMINSHKRKFSNKDFYSFLRIWSELMKKSSMENLIFCAVGLELNRNLSIDKLTLFCMDFSRLSCLIKGKLRKNDFQGIKFFV